MKSFSSYNFHPVNELAIPTKEWELSKNDDKMMFAEEDLLAYHGKSSLSSDTETTNNTVVLGQWEEDDHDMADAICHTKPLEELLNDALLFDKDEDHHNYHLHHNTTEDQQGFLAPLINDIYTIDKDLLSSDDTETTTNNMVVLGQEEEDDHEMKDAIFHTKPLEELFNDALLFDNDEEDHYHYHLHHDNTIHDKQEFSSPLIINDVYTTDDNLWEESTTTSSIGLPLEERYKATLEKLEASMKRSQETRNCLTMKTVTTESYERVGSVKEILSSIATSSNQVQKYVTSIQRQI